MSDNPLVLNFCPASQTLSDSYSTKKTRNRKLCREQDSVSIIQGVVFFWLFSGSEKYFKPK